MSERKREQWAALQAERAKAAPVARADPAEVEAQRLLTVRQHPGWALYERRVMAERLKAEAAYRALNAALGMGQFLGDEYVRKLVELAVLRGRIGAHAADLAMIPPDASASDATAPPEAGLDGQTEPRP